MSNKFNYINILNINWPHFEKEISSEEWMCICLLSGLTVPYDCTLHSYGEKDGKAIRTIKDFGKVWDMREKPCKLMVDSLREKEALVYDSDNNEYILNPYIMLKGDEISNRTLDLVKNTRWYKYAQEGET